MIKSVEGEVRPGFYYIRYEKATHYYKHHNISSVY